MKKKVNTQAFMKGVKASLFEDGFYHNLNLEASLEQAERRGDKIKAKSYRLRLNSLWDQVQQKKGK